MSTKTDRLTKKQNQLIEEIKAIIEIAGLNYENLYYVNKDAITIRLEVIKKDIIISNIIRTYTFVDEVLNSLIVNYFFQKQRNFIKMWKTKRFKIFNYFILENLYLMQKLALVKSINKMPKEWCDRISRLNVIRNGVAHSFFPENLNKSKPLYKGKSVFFP